MKNAEKVLVCEHVIELRHSASGKFLDQRGLVADYIKSEELFPFWEIDTNVVKFKDGPDRPQKTGAFIGFKSLAFFAYDPDTRQYFEDKAIQFWRTVSKNNFYTVPDLNRFGCRTKAFLNSSLSFEEINKQLYSKYFSSEFRSLINESEEDFQIVVDLKDKEFKTRLVIGPLHKDEAPRFFSLESDRFSQTGVFLDIDVSRSESIDHKDVPKFTKSAMQKIWSLIKRLEDSLEI